MWAHLKTKIVAMLRASALLQEVYDYEASEFGGDPVAVVIASRNESDYRTTTANRRIYAFNIQLWVKYTEPRDAHKSEQVLTDLVDSVLDLFDKYYTLGTGSPGAALVLRTGHTMIRTQALPSQWMYTERETTYRGAEIVLTCELDVDVTAISYQ